MSGRLSVWALGLLCALVGAIVFADVASANTLPDGRIFEQVTPEEKDGSDVYQPEVFLITSELGGTKYSEQQKAEAANSTIETMLTFQAAADGAGIAFAAAPTVGGNQNQGKGGGNEYLARRSAAGWTESVLSPENAPSSIFQAFSADLTKAFLNSVEPLSPTAPGFGEVSGNSGAYDVLYATATTGEEYVPLFSTKPPYRSMEAFGTAGPFGVSGGGNNQGARAGHTGYLAFEGSSADDSHLLFAANDALTDASEGRPAAEGGSGSEFAEENNLYDSVNGRLRLVNVLPDGTTHANAAFGGVEESGLFKTKRNVLSHAISADGSRIFWTDLSTGHIYMREDGSRTVEISPQRTYQAATSDGSSVLYTNGDLYAYDVETGQSVDLTPGVGVAKVLGASENGEYVYYVTAANELMLWHDGASNPIADVSPAQAEVTPSGHSIVFMVTEDPPSVGQTTAHVEVYDADTGTLYCATCTALGKLGMLPMTNHGNVYQPRWISADGSRVFFVTVEGLVPQDTNEVQDVYEWERPGSGECAESSGCVYLLSGGTSPAHSGFLDASENGNDVFIVTRASLVGSDEDDLFDVYDVGVRSPLVAPPACTGTGCQGVPNPTPIFATPSSVTFEGVGNFAAPGKETKAKPKPKKKPKLKKKPTHKKKKGKKKTKAKKSARKAAGRRRSSSKGGRS
jgi:hypothetical protein